MAPQELACETVKRFLHSGAKVVIADLADCSELAQDLDCMSIQVDVRQLDQMQMLMKRTVEAYGNIDILVNNAGVFADYKSLLNSSAEDFQYCFDINLMGIANGIKAAVPLMNNPASIINTAFTGGGKWASSISAHTQRQNMPS